MNFGLALDALKCGEKVQRAGWNGKGMWIALMPAHAPTGMNRAFIFMKAVNNDTVPWVASQTDLLADDWVLIHNAG